MHGGHFSLMIVIISTTLIHGILDNSKANYLFIIIQYLPTQDQSRQGNVKIKKQKHQRKEKWNIQVHYTGI